MYDEINKAIEQIISDWTEEDELKIKEDKRRYNKTKKREARVGKHASLETRQKMSDRTLSPEHVQKLRESRTGKNISSETRQRISEAITGKKRTEEQRQRMSEAQRRRFSKQNDE